MASANVAAFTLPLEQLALDKVLVCSALAGLCILDCFQSSLSSASEDAWGLCTPAFQASQDTRCQKHADTAS